MEEMFDHMNHMHICDSERFLGSTLWKLWKLDERNSTQYLLHDVEGDNTYVVTAEHLTFYLSCD